MKFWNNTKNRKLKVCASVLVFGTLVWFLAGYFGGVDCALIFNDWSTFTQWIVGLYFFGNIGEHGMKALNNNKTEENNEYEQLNS